MNNKYEVMKCKMRTKKEIGAIENECFEKVWYNKYLLHQEDKVDKNIKNEADKLAKEIEKKYGKENLIYDDFEWGRLNGRLETLRWALGDEWGMLDS